MVEESGCALGDNPLSSAQLRYTVRTPTDSSTPGPSGTRPFGLRFARTVLTPTSVIYTYSHIQQVAVGDDGRPLVETKGKEWKTKSSTDGDEGPEENWDWEES